MTDYIGLQSTIFGNSLYSASDTANYSAALADMFLSCVVAPATKKTASKTASYSNYSIPIDYSDLRLAGYSRNHGDASSQVQMNVMQKILDASTDLSSEDQAILLSFARLESGFNPDAAATTTSASGVFQFINSTGSAYGLNAESRFDAAANIDAGVRFYKDNVRILEKKFPGLAGNERAAKLYALHHDGPSLQYGGEEIARKGILPYLEKFRTVAEEYQQG